MYRFSGALRTSNTADMQRRWGGGESRWIGGSSAYAAWSYSCPQSVIVTGIRGSPLSVPVASIFLRTPKPADTRAHARTQKGQPGKGVSRPALAQLAPCTEPPRREDGGGGEGHSADRSHPPSTRLPNTTCFPSSHGALQRRRGVISRGPAPRDRGGAHLDERDEKLGGRWHEPRRGGEGAGRTCMSADAVRRGQPVGRRHADLRAVAVGPRVRHGQDARSGVAQHKILVLERLPVNGLPASACAEMGRFRVERGWLWPGARATPFPAVMSPPWHTKFGIMLATSVGWVIPSGVPLKGGAVQGTDRWNVEPRKVKSRRASLWPASPVHSCLKFSLVRGTTSARSSKTRRPAGWDPITMSK